LFLGIQYFYLVTIGGQSWYNETILWDEVDH